MKTKSADEKSGSNSKRKDVLFDRQQLETLAGGRISSVFGPLFEEQDQYKRQVRMPEPPLLLADRVIKIEGEPRSMSKGTIWTETDVDENGWYIHEGRMPPGVMIESGQADLLLISWLGIDFFNKGERIYRLLGCELSYEGPLPKPSETLCYEIHLDGMAKQGDIRLMFFHYDCYVDGQLRMKVRHGQAGFFTDKELLDSSGVIWSADKSEYTKNPRLAPPLVECQYKRFTSQQVLAFANGNTYECFGKGFEYAETHTHSPRIQTGRMLFLDHISHFDPKGGPNGRGYLRAVQKVSPDDWFFNGHFKNDPCMPGTLMAEAGLQLISFYIAALGFTLDKDGWRFEPVQREVSKMRCRGQCVPTSREVVYEIFIDEVVAEPRPTVYVDLLATVDGLKAFHANRFAIQLVPDWPLSRLKEALEGYLKTKEVASVADCEFDYPALLAAALGKPTDAFGKFSEKFNDGSKCPRLPGPPYLLVTRILKIDGEIGCMRQGISLEAEYDVPPDAWYFKENDTAVMPFGVLMEIGLQPCGWLASYAGCAAALKDETFFRNLDGVGTVYHDVLPDAGSLRTKTKLKSLARLGSMILVSFDVEVFQQEKRVFAMDTGFGFFPGEAFANQAGLPISDRQKELLQREGNFNIDLTLRPEKYAGSTLHLADQMLLMIDRVTGFWPKGGEKGLGEVRAEKKVNPAEWFFKAHFYRDPVQPGSLGVQALTQLLQFYMIHENMHEGMSHPQFESVALERAVTWKYRGQVVPKNKVIGLTMEVTERGIDHRGPYIVATASLFVDGKRIYQLDNLGMRIVDNG